MLYVIIITLSKVNIEHSEIKLEFFPMVEVTRSFASVQERLTVTGIALQP